MHMEPLNSEMFENGNDRREAYKNAMTIKSNVLKLVHFFRRDDMQTKLMREFRDVANRLQQNEIQNFTGHFEKTKQLWFTKLATSLEDHNRMQEQVELSQKRVRELSDQLKAKKENLDKYDRESKDDRDKTRIEIENLKKARTDLATDKFNQETAQIARGEAIRDANEKRH